MYLNQVMLIGNLTRDPEIKALPSGSNVANLSIATNRVWKDQSGARQEATEYHNVVAFGKQADTIAQYCTKGSSLLITGRLQTRSWEKDNVKQYRTEIVLESFQFGAKRVGEPQGTSNGQSEKKTETEEYPDEEINLEDIPF